MKIIVSNAINNSNTRHTALGLAEAGLLYNYYTSVAIFPNSIMDFASNLSFLSEFKRRKFEIELKPFIKTSPWFELARQVSQKANLNSLIAHEKGVFHIDSVSKHLDKKVAKNLKRAKDNNAEAVYSYEDNAYYAFKQAKSVGLKCFYDLPIGYWRKAHQLLEIERQKWPDWQNTLGGFSDSESKLSRKDEELKMADAIFVASTFTANSLKEYPGELSDIHVIPYGFPTVSKENRSYSNLKASKKLKLLFVGSLSQRKGIANMFEAVEQFSDYVDLTVVGYPGGGPCPALQNALSKHKWIPTLSHEKVLELMRASDVLLFPSLFEGFGLVITEAMSQGTPVITTERTAGPDVITHDANGWLIDAGSTEQLKAQIERLLQNPSLITKAGKAAQIKAESWTWADYGLKLTETISSLI